MSDSVRPYRWQPTRLPRPWDSPGKNTGVGCHFLLQCRRVKSESQVAQSCPTLSNPMDCSLPGSSIHGIFQTRVLEWGAIAFSCNSSIMSVLSITFWPSLPTLKLIPDSKIVSDMPTLVIHDSSVILLSLIYFHYYLTYIINHCDEISPAYTCLSCFFFSP